MYAKLVSVNMKKNQRGRNVIVSQLTYNNEDHCWEYSTQVR